jgi:hypothetical protein
MDQTTDWLKRIERLEDRVKELEEVREWGEEWFKDKQVLESRLETEGKPKTRCRCGGLSFGYFCRVCREFLD